MTIAGGMVCTDGILVYADTEWTATTLKIQRGKHWYLGGVPRLKCVLAGAGGEDNLRLAIQAFWTLLLKRDANTIRTKDVHECLQNAIAHVYAEHIYPDPHGNEGEFGIIMGVSTPDDPPMLFKTAKTGILIADSYEYVYLGTGSEMAMYLASRLDVRDAPLEFGEAMASFILWEVKQHVQTCGGETVIYKLPRSGGIQFLGEGEAREIEEYFASIDRKIQRLRVNSAVLRRSDEEFEKRLKDFCDDLRIFRKARQERLEREKDFTS